MSEEVYVLSPLHKTWIFDIDGTIVKHNGYISDGEDTILDGAKAFFSQLSPEDRIILLTSRAEEYADATIEFLKRNTIRFDHIIFGVPYGERILVNDKKPSGLPTALAINPERDTFMNVSFQIDPEL